MSRKKHSVLWKKSYLWVTLALFVMSISLHWYFGWQTYKTEQEEHRTEVQVSEYAAEMLKDTMENWQSEFLQLIWQVAGLAFLFYIGSPQSKEGDDRMEEKLDFIIKKLEPDQYAELMKKWEEKYPKK
jgi:hypothetical protein